MRAELAVLSGLGAFTAVSMAVYVAGDRRRLSSRDVTGRGGSFALGYWIRNWFYWLIRPVKAVSLLLRLSPLFFNVAAVLCGVASMVFFARGHLPAAGAMILLSGLADVMDGEVARSRRMTSAWGAFVDSSLDRFSEFAALGGLAAYFGSGTPVLLVVTALGGSMLVSYTRARGESLGVLCKAGLMQRAERMLLLGFGAVVDPALSAALGRESGFVLVGILWIVAVGTVATSVYRTVWIARELRRVEAG